MESPQITLLLFAQSWLTCTSTKQLACARASGRLTTLCRCVLALIRQTAAAWLESFLFIQLLFAESGLIFGRREMSLGKVAWIPCSSVLCVLPFPPYLLHGCIPPHTPGCTPPAAKILARRLTSRLPTE